MKKAIYLSCIMLVLTITAISQEFGSFVDPRDGKTYKTVIIGNQVWMAENLNTNLNTETAKSWCYDNNPVNCATYGRLYTWEVANKVCPPGWHLPSDEEWTRLTDYLDPESNVSGKLKEAGTNNWEYHTYGATNETGFTALPGGIRNNFGICRELGITGYWWTSSEHETFYKASWTRSMSTISFGVDRYTQKWDNGLSVRCIKD